MGKSRPLHIAATPDTGCTRTLITGRIAKENKLQLEKDGTILVAANGERMQVAGRVMLKVKLGDKEVELDALVSDHLREDMLVSWQDLIRLGVISENFPNTIANARCVLSDGITKRLKEDYPDSVGNTLTNRPVSAYMRIAQAAGAIPKKCTNARRVPQRFEKESNKVIKELTQGGIIKKFTGISDWCSPAFFVPKADNVRVRLVTDFTELNKTVKRPVHLFPSSMDIIQAIPSTAKCFAKLDAVNGYFQLGLHEDSQPLTVFLLQQGKFC